MALPRIYKTAGTVSVGSGASVFTGISTLFGGSDLEGAVLRVLLADEDDAYTYVGTVEAIDPRFPEGQYENLGPIPLINPWQGAPISGRPYILELSAATVPSSLATSLFGRFLAYLENSAGVVHDSRDLSESDFDQFTYGWIYNADLRAVQAWRGGVLETLEIIGTAFNPVGPWVGDPVEKFALSISTGDTDIDGDDGSPSPDASLHYALVVDGNTEIQLPTNAADGTEIHILLTIDGGPHAITFAAGYVLPEGFEIRDGDGERTRIKITVTADTDGDATAATVELVSFPANTLVDDRGFAYVSNIDDNTFEPQIDGDDEGISNIHWTKLTTGGRGPAGEPGSSDVVATSASSVEIGTGSKNFTVVETNRGWAVGARLRISRTSAPTTTWMEGVVTSYSGVSLQISVDDTAGSGTHSDWTINLAGEKGDTGSNGIDGASQFVRVRVVDTAGGDPASAYEDGDTVDGVELDENDVVLRASVTDPEKNGPYVVPASGAAARHSAFENYNDLPGVFFSVMEGTVNEDTLWRVSSDKGGTIDVTGLDIDLFAPDAIAASVAFTPAGGIASSNVQDAIEELDSEKQATHANLSAFSGLSLVADRLPYSNGAGTLALATFTSAARNLLDDGDVATQLATLTALGQGVHDIWIDASFLTPRATNGFQFTDYDSGANDVTLRVAAFDTSTQEYGHFKLRMPKSWNEGTVTFIPVWTNTGGSATQNVVWSLAGRALGDDDAINGAMGTAQTSGDTFLSQNDYHAGPESSAITIGNSPAEGDLVVFEVSRVVGSDNMAGDALLIGLVLRLTINAPNDA